MFWLLLLQVFACAYGYFDVDEINNIKYDIDILDLPVPMTQASENGDVLLASKFGQQYQCSFPGGQQEVDLEEKKKEQIALETGIVELLKPMKDVDCLTLVKGWWTYELCYGVHIRQYHVEDGVAHDSNYLGFYRSDFDWSSMKEEHAKAKPYKQRYHSQEYVNGTMCDLTGKLRRSEVRFYCDQHNGDYLSTVDELETCVYTLTVYTSRICNHPYLKPPKRTKAVPILCSPLLTPDEYKEYLKLKDEEEALKKGIMLESENQDINSEPADGTDTPTSSSDTDTQDNEWQDYNIDSAVDALQKLITQSLTEGLDSVFDGNNRGKKIKITKLKTTKMRQEQLATTIKEIMSKAEGQGSMEDEEVDKDGKSDDSTEIAKTTGEVKDESVDDVVGDDDGDYDDDIDVDEVTLLKEFDKGLDEIAKSGKHLEEIKQYKEEIQQEMNTQFAEIIREAEEELNDAGFQEQVDRDTVLKTMSETLEKLLKRLEGKEGTGNKKELASMIDKAAAAALKKLKSGSSTDGDGVQEHVVHMQDNTGDVGHDGDEQVMTKGSDENDKDEVDVKEHDQTKKFPYLDDEDDEDDDEEDAISLEYEINYGGQTIQVKIFTTDDYINGDGETSLFHTNGALNRMLVAVLGSNTEEIEEAKRQNKLNTNYGFVWKKARAKKQTSKSDNH